MKVLLPQNATAIDAFLERVLGCEEFDAIVPVERKGTALLRAFVDSHECPELWSKVISTQALDALKRLRPKKILLLDDSVLHGSTLIQAKKDIRACAPDADVTVVAFVSHCDAPQDLLDFVYYRGVDDQGYEECRTQMISYLRSKGSLLLDTEHVEIRASITSTPGEFFSALAGWGEAVRFAAEIDRVNCTVLQNPARIEGLEEIVASMGVGFEDAVCKLRVITLPETPREFSIIPIFYPSVSTPDSATYVHPRMPWTKNVTGAQRLFQVVGLSLSIELARDVMSWLNSALRGRIEFSLGGSAICHLHAIFPEMVTEEVETEIRRTDHRWLSRKTRVGAVDDPGLEQLEELADTLLLRCYSRDAFDSGSLRALTTKDLAETVRLSGQTRARVSAALDILIDSARIMPKIASDQQGLQIRASRVFAPDGEMAGRRILRRALELGMGTELSLAM